MTDQAAWLTSSWPFARTSVLERVRGLVTPLATVQSDRRRLGRLAERLSEYFVLPDPVAQPPDRQSRAAQQPHAQSPGTSC